MSAIRKTFLSNLLLVVGLNLLVKPLYVLVVEARVQDRLGPDEFGLYFALLNLSFIFNIIPDLGITNWNNRLIAQWRFVPAERLRKLFSIRLILGSAYVLICLITAFLMHYAHREVLLLLILAFNQVLATGIQFLRSFLSGLHHFRADSVLSILDRALLIAILSGLLITTENGNDFKLEYLVYSQTLAYALSLVVALILVTKRASSQASPAPLLSRSILRESAPFALLILLSMLANRQDGILLERLHSSHEAGIYAMAYRLGDVLNMFSFLFAGLLLPMFSRLLEQRQSIGPLFEQSTKLLFAGAWTATLIGLFYPQWILALIYDTPVQAAAEVLPWVMLSAFLFSMQYITGTLLTASGNMRPLIVIAGLAMLYNLMLNVLYVPEQGALGAAKAACFMQVIVLAAQLLPIQQHFAALKRKLIFALLAYLIITTTTVLLLKQTSVPWLFQLGITLMVCLISALGLKMLQWSDLLALLQQRASTEIRTTENR
ncbi:MAG: oligosaccharide flippase family protein [Flavobacteriales bacterium]|jgi:O-antigen/teichoic acid export membrane protein